MTSSWGGGGVCAYCGHFQYVAQWYRWILHVKAINMLANVNMEECLNNLIIVFCFVGNS